MQRPDSGVTNADAGAPEQKASERTPEEKRVEEAVQRAARTCTPPAKWSACEDATTEMKAARRKETAVSDAFLLELLEHARSTPVRQVIAALFLDVERASPLLRDRALATRLVNAADREPDPDVASVLASAIGNVDLETTNLDDRIRDFALIRKEALGGNFAARVVHNAASSPRAAAVTGAWLSSGPSPFRRVVQLSVSTEANDRQEGAAFCAAMLAIGTKEPSGNRAALDAVATGEGCTKAQRSAANAAAAKAALERR